MWKLPPLLLPFVASAQIVCSLGSGASSYKSGSDQRPTADAMELAGRVNTALKTICATNCPTVALFRNPTAPNAMLIAESGKAKLVYAPQFFAAAYESQGDGAILAVIAHELGHALDDSLGAVWVKSSWPPEVRADSWAACALARMDLSASDLEAAITALAKYPPPVQTNWTERFAGMRAGYTQCGGDASKLDKLSARLK